MANTGRDGVMKKVALGATGLAITAGVVAAGVALANKNNRRKLIKGTKRTIKDIRRVRGAIEKGAAYQAIAHRIVMARKKNQEMMPKSAHGRRKLRRAA